MNIPLSVEFIDICRSIVSEAKTEHQWAEVESGDMFQSAMFCGGFDADEMQFCFSFYPEEGVEYWFQFSLFDARKIATGSHYH